MQHQRPSRAQNKQIKLVLVFLKKENTGRGNISQANTPNRLNAVLLGSETRQERPLSPSTQHGTWGAGGGVGWSVGWDERAVKESHAGQHTSETHSVGKFSVAGEEAVEAAAPHPRPRPRPTAVTQRLECHFSRGHV